MKTLTNTKPYKRLFLPSIKSTAAPLLTNRYGLGNKAISKVLKNSGVIDTLGAEGGFGAIQTMEDMLESFAKYTWVYSAIYTIANNAAGIPIILYEESNDGSTIVEITEHPILDVLNKPNPYMTRQDLIEGTFVYLESTGNCFWELVKNKKGVIKEIYFLNPKNVKIYPDPVKYIRKYTYCVNGREIDIAPENVMHYKYFNPLNEYWGQSSLSASADALMQERNAITYNKKFFTNSARPDVIFNVSGPLNDRSFKRMKAMLKQMFGGVEKAHSAAIIEGGIKVEQLGFAPKDLEFLNLRKYNRDEILACFGVPPAMVGVFETAIRANAKEQRKQFWEGAMVQKLKKVEISANQNLIPKFSTVNGKRKLVLAFDLTGVESLGESTEAKTTRLTQLVRDGIMSRNEARIEIGYETIDDENMDAFFISSNFLPIQNAVDRQNDIAKPDVQDPSLDVTPPDQPKEVTRVARRGFKFSNIFNDKALLLSSNKALVEYITVHSKKQMLSFLNKYCATINNKLADLRAKKANKMYSRKITKSLLFNEKSLTDEVKNLMTNVIDSSFNFGARLATYEIVKYFNLIEVDLQRTIDVSRNITDYDLVTNALNSVLNAKLSTDLDANDYVLDCNELLERIELNLTSAIMLSFNRGRFAAAKELSNEYTSLTFMKIWLKSEDCSSDVHELNEKYSRQKPNDLYQDFLTIEEASCHCKEIFVPGNDVLNKLMASYKKHTRLTNGWVYLLKKKYHGFTKVERIEQYVSKILKDEAR